MDPKQQSTASRVARLKKRFHDVLAGTVKIDPRGANLFLEGICVQDDPVVCLNVIIESAHGLSSVQSAMRYDLSTQFMNGLGSTVLEYFLQDCDVGGITLENVLFHIVDPPIFWSAFVSAFRQDTLSDSAQLVFARVLSRLLTLQAHDTNPYRDLARQPAVLDKLVASSKHEIRETGHLIRHILSDTNLATALDVISGPGGRHDNDSPDFRKISIIPTGDEVMCQKPSFLRTAFHDDLDTTETSEDGYLDNIFRMLREDMIFDIREGIQVALQTKKGKHRGLCVNRLSIAGVYTGDGDRKTRWGIELRCGQDFGQMKAIEEPAARVRFLTRDPRGSRILKHQSLVCLVAGKDIISFGTVNRVEELLASNPPIIVLQLDGASNITKTITSLCAVKDIQLIQIDTATFAFEPVLSALQKMRTVPLSKEILFWNADVPVESARNTAALSHVTDKLASDYSIDIGRLLELPKSIHLDQPQAKSMIGGLAQRVSLIQGPPGTGKSFIGALLSKAIHDKTPQTILVVCYTNHALDQFVGDLLKYDIPDGSIVRLGGRANQATEHLALQRQPRAGVRYPWERIKELRKAASSLDVSLRNHFNAILDMDKSLLTQLRLHQQEFFDAFHVPLVDEDGMTRVGQNGKAIDEKYLFDRWRRGKGAGVLQDEPHVRAAAHIWSMDHSARNQLMETWLNEFVAKAAESISQAGQKQSETQAKIKSEFGESTVAILRNKRIIACTTTGAAIYADAINKVGPQVLLVEEAGEILESHLLTALSQRVERMILIGDHKQLRPKVNNYRLTVEKGEGFDLNRSLFERLVLKGYPHTTLAMQHRMRPEISTFVRELTYPELVDAPSTLQRPDIRGVHSNVIFVDHTHPEDDESLVGDRLDGGATASKQNTYEADMVFKIVRYLVQQGYKSENVVVLTPYLGQLYKLREVLKRENDPILNDMDAADLARAGISTVVPPEQKSKKAGIRLSTIDNYQGEESDIVVASLTRSNKSNAIGFMNSPERLNVLLSRARDGLILIGNSLTFVNSKQGGPLWGRLFALLKKGQYVYQGFPVWCQGHPERAVLLKHATDFDSKCPDGGCMQACGFILACGHTCPMKCHPDRSHAPSDPHNISQCKHQMNARCPVNRHQMRWECRTGQPSTCSACDKEAERLEAIARKELEAQKKREEAEAEHKRSMAELEAELESAKEAEEKRKHEEEERKRQEEESKRQEEERTRKEEEHRRLVEKLKRQAEERTKQEEERRREEERLRLEEQRTIQVERSRKLAEERMKQEAERQREEERLRQEEERRTQVERLMKLAEERTKQVEERRREEERLRQEEERRTQVERLMKLAEERMKQVEERRREEERLRQEEERRTQVERLRKLTEERTKQVEDRRREEERLRLEEECRIQVKTLRKLAKERTKQEEERTRKAEEQRREDECLQAEELARHVSLLKRQAEKRRKSEERRTREEMLRKEEAHRRLEEARGKQEGLHRLDEYRAQRERKEAPSRCTVQ